ncbi:MAG: aminotransferase class I/II-fold pyridoxal phosphate-dependent enzyme, partial [Myxococcales bacterium]|nr:aminotransferase class I/II-fold pyridoxal phosphate-dependent enzyme [Myxococcales bacterium]
LARDHGLTLEVVHNPAVDGANGTSLLAARDWITEDCLLLMADHLYPPALLERFRRAEVRRGGCLLAVDARPERCFDLADATKVRRAGDRVVAIGKRLTDYDAVDCGVFRIGRRLVEALAQHLAMHGDCAITDGAAALAAEGRLWAEPVGDTPWVDVDTPEALRHAEARLALHDPTIAGVTRHAPAWVRAAAPYDRAHFDDAERAPEAARLMANESPLGPSPAVLAAVAEAAREAHRYPRSSTRLRERLALREGLSAERVIVGAGSAELIDLAVRTFVTPGDEAVIVVPSFSLYEARTRVAGGIPRRVPRAPDGDLDLAALAAAVTDRTKLLFLCRPNNPTGHCDPVARVEALLELDRPTVIDEAYLAPDDPRSLRRLLDRYDHLILLRSFSKVHGLAGLRVGYALASGSAVKLMAAVQLPWSLSAPALAAADAVLDEQ